MKRVLYRTILPQGIIITMIYYSDLSQWLVDPFCFQFVSVGSVCKYRYEDIVLHQEFIFIINECNDCSKSL